MHPASSFINIMAMPMSSPVPVEILQYLPGSVQEEKHFISDGPYTITSYTPNVSYTLAKNPAWQQSTDSLASPVLRRDRHHDGRVNPTTIQQQLADRRRRPRVGHDGSRRRRRVAHELPAVRRRLHRRHHLPRLQHEEHHQRRGASEAVGPRGARSTAPTSATSSR